jgi:hypothetical protein
MLKALSTRKWLSTVFCLFLLVATVISLVPGGAMATDLKITSPYMKVITDKDGNELLMTITPVKPPAIKMAAAEVMDVHIAGVLNVLSNVPAFNWSYGCSATSASMLFGYYDRHGYGNMYAGPANGGVCPLNNSTWGSGECPINASHQGVDGRTDKGHVDDYWEAYGEPDPLPADPTTYSDPWVSNWPEHTADCAGDYMGTNQWKYFGKFGNDNTDGSTLFFYYTDGSPTYNADLTGLEPVYRDGLHGMTLFAESLGYTVLTSYNQLIPNAPGWGNTNGFTFADYMAEIDAGSPVLIQVDGHTMLGYGYNAATSQVYIHDTWDYNNHVMTWGGSYAGMAQIGVTVLHLAPPPGNYGYYQIWWLDSAKDASGNPVMENIGTQSGSVPLEDGNMVLWKSNQSATSAVVFDAGTWTVCLNTTDLAGDYSVQIGESEGGAGFSAFGELPETGTFHSPLTLYITLPSVTVPAGHNLALRVSNTGTGSVITNSYSSYVGSPLSKPSYPMPELSSGILAGLGLTGLAAFVFIKRKKSRVALGA